MAIELWFVDLSSDAEEHVENAACVPHIGCVVDMTYGTRKVEAVQYDFHPTNGNVRVHIRVGPTTTAS